MKKTRTTKKAIKNRYSNILALGYCELQSLLAYLRPFAYSAGVYGWACDYYRVGDAIISTGYSPIGVRAKYERVKDVERRFKEFCEAHRFEACCEAEALRLLAEFVAACGF